MHVCWALGARVRARELTTRARELTTRARELTTRARELTTRATPSLLSAKMPGLFIRS